MPRILVDPDKGNLDPTDTKRTCSAHLSNKWMPEMESLGDLRSKTLCPTCLFGWSSAVTRLLATSNFAPFGYSGGANLMPEQLDLHRARAHHQT